MATHRSHTPLDLDPFPFVMTTPTPDPRQDAWLWRLFVTGFAFCLFGLGGLFLRVAVFPSQRLMSGNSDRRQARARVTIARTFRLFIAALRRTGVLAFDFQGGERLGRPGQLIIANHPSLLDVAFLISQIDNTSCIIKHGLTRNPFTRGPVTAAGYISNDESADMLNRASDALRGGQTLIVFPEGTRTPPGDMPRFHRGACAIALRGASVITPVVIRMTPRSLVKSEPWYRIPTRRIHYDIRVGPDIDPSHWSALDAFPTAGRKLNQYLHAYFAEELRKS